MICNKEYNSVRSLGLHLSSSHKDVNKQEYYDKYMKSDSEGICPVCGKPTKYKGGLNGYRRTCCISCGQKHPDTRQKLSDTNLERYGATNPYGSKEIRDKIKAHNLEKYGVENPFCLPGVNEKAVRSSTSEKANEKRKQTCLAKYGTEYHIASNEVRSKSIETYQKRYGVSNAYSIPHINQKAKYNSLGYKHNGNDSSWETLLENALKDHEITYIKQYRDQRYPYNCDFYLPDTDTFIEINGFWMHGGHWFDPNSKEDQQRLQLWTSKINRSSLYASAITNWTISDLAKRDCAIENNLNYVVLWTLDDIHNYIATL